jgi:hypothetical protein
MSRATHSLVTRQMQRRIAQAGMPTRSTIDVARQRATRLTEAEIAETTAPHRLAAKRLREGVATEQEHNFFLTMVFISLAIEESGLIRGMRLHLEAAQTALQAIAERARASGTWHQDALDFAELEAIDTALWLHTEQLRHLAWIELHNITRKFLARHQSAGGQVEHITLQEALS